MEEVPGKQIDSQFGEGTDNPVEEADVKERKHSYRRKVRLITWLHISLPIITDKRVNWRNRNWVGRILLNIIL